MRDKNKVNERLTIELLKMDQQMARLETSNPKHGQTVKTLQDYVEVYRRLFDSFPIGITILDMKGFI